MKSNDLKVAWSLSAVLQNIAFFTQYTEDLSMAASDNHFYTSSLIFVYPLLKSFNHETGNANTT